ncbi:MAG: hypothetical protein BWX47_01744 [candidate division Hyd24-12 bacterium ADurb.Bin004]|nr:MAG: hypothetical protein BWX47_01744 [candidate division Hyd24-12 bacterium ADurb.Bin004]
MISVVRLESRIVMKALENPASTAGLIPLPARRSSRMRSRMRTFASTDMPMVSTIPAIPGRVSVAPRPETPRRASGPGKQSVAMMMSMLRIRPRVAITPPVP